MRYLVAALLPVIFIAGCTQVADDSVAPAIQLAQTGGALPAAAQAAPEEIVTRVIANPTDMQFSADGSRLLIREGQRTLAIWDAREREPISVRRLPDRAQLAARSRDGAIALSLPGRQWRIGTWNADEYLHEFELPPDHRIVALSDDGATVVVDAGREGGYLMRTSDRAKLFSLPRPQTNAPISATDFDGDRRVLLGYADGSIRLYHIATGETRELRPSPEHWIPPMLSSLSSPPNPTVTHVELRGNLAAAVGNEIGCFVWDAESGELLARPLDPEDSERRGRASTLALSPDGRSVAFATQSDIREWSIVERAANVLVRHRQPEFPTLEVPRHGLPDMAGMPWYDSWHRPSQVFDLRYTDDGALMAAGTFSGVSWLWRERADERPQGLAPGPFFQEAVPLAARFDAEDGLVVWTRGITPKSTFAFPPGSADNPMWLHLEDEGMRRILRWAYPGPPREESTVFAFSHEAVSVIPHSDRIVTTVGTWGHPLGVWSALDGTEVALLEGAPAWPENLDAEAVAALRRPSYWTHTAFDEAGNLMALARRHEVRLISLPDKAEVRTFTHEEESLDPLRALALSADGSRLAVHHGKVLIIDVASGEEVARLPADHGIITSNMIALSPSGDRLAVGGMGVTIYDANSGERLGFGPASHGNAQSIRFSPGGELVAAGYHDGTVVLHEGSSGEVIAAISAHGGPAWEVRRPGRPALSGEEFPIVAFSADSSFLTSVGADGTVAVTDAQAGKLLARLMWVGGPDVPEGGWIAWTPDGRYDGTDAAIAACIRFRDGDRLVPAAHFPDRRIEGLIDTVLGR